MAQKDNSMEQVNIECSDDETLADKSIIESQQHLGDYMRGNIFMHKQDKAKSKAKTEKQPSPSSELQMRQIINEDKGGNQGGKERSISPDKKVNIFKKNKKKDPNNSIQVVPIAGDMPVPMEPEVGRQVGLGARDSLGNSNGPDSNHVSWQYQLPANSQPQSQNVSASLAKDPRVEQTSNVASGASRGNIFRKSSLSNNDTKSNDSKLRAPQESENPILKLTPQFSKVEKRSVDWNDRKSLEIVNDVGLHLIEAPEDL